MPGEYLPPLVVSVEANADSLFRVLVAAEGALEEFSDTPSTVRIDADDAPFQTTVANVESEMAALDGQTATVHVRVDASGLASTAAQVGAIQAAAHQATGGHWGVFSGLGAAAAVHAAGGGGGGGGFIPGAVAGGAGGHGGGPGLLAALGWGAGMWGMAGMGSIAALAGFGPEHLITTGLGLAGSAAGGLLGGGLLASGYLGTAAVGGGSDLAVALEQRQAEKALIQGIISSKDATAAEQALVALKAGSLDLAQATALYGQAAAVAQQQTAQLAVTTDTQWLKAIGPALIQLSTLKDSLYGLAQTYIPLVAGAADRNFAIINQSIKPLFAWLEGPEGIAIFQHLEDVFARDLPYAVDAFDQGVELLLKTINVASDYSGGFIVKLDDFLKRMNSPAGFRVWEGEIGRLIGLWHEWEALIKIAGLDVVDFFKLSAGLGTGIVESLTQALTRLNQWETSTSGTSSLHALFAAHLHEVLDALKLIYDIIPSLAQVYLRLAVPLTIVADSFFKFADLVLNTPIIGAIASWGLAIDIFASKMKLLTFSAWVLNATGLSGAIGTLVGWLSKLALGWLGVARAADTAAASQATAAVVGGATSTEAAASSGLRATGGGLLGLLTGGATDLTPFLTSLGVAAAAAAGIAGTIYGVGFALDALTGNINTVSGKFAALINPVIKLNQDLGVSDQASNTIKNALTSNSGQFAVAISQMTQSAWFSHLAAYQQQNVMQSLASALQAHLVSTPQDVATFAQAWREAESKSALTVPLVDDVYSAFKTDSTQLKTSLAHIVSDFQNIDHNTAATTVPSAQSIGDILKTTVPITDQIHQIMQYTQQGTKNLGDSTWKAYGGADNLSATLWGASGSGIGLASSSLAASLWAASGAAASLRGALSADFGNIGNLAVGPIPHAAGGSVFPGIPYLVGEKGPEIRVFSSPGYIVPNSQLGSSLSAYYGGGTTNNITVPMTMNVTLQGTDQQMLAQMETVAQRAVHKGLLEALSASGV